MDAQLRRVIITGANRGLGHTLARTLCKNHKYDLLLTARKADDVQNLLKSLKAEFPNSVVQVQQLDISASSSISQFSQWIAKNYSKFDILVNNAAIIDKGTGYTMESIFQTNLFGTIELTEALLPSLSDDGKVIFVSSVLGRLQSQPENIKKALNDSAITNQKIREIADGYVSGKGAGWNQGYCPIYSASKALLNSYLRFPLMKLIKNNQSVYALCPGWCKTDLGGKEAPNSQEEGIAPTLYLITEVPFGRNQQHGQFIDNKKNIYEY